MAPTSRNCSSVNGSELPASAKLRSASLGVKISTVGNTFNSAAATVRGVLFPGAKVPHSEMLSYSSELRSMTGGEGTYSMKQSHYDPLPSHLAQQVIAQWKQIEKDEE